MTKKENFLKGFIKENPIFVFLLGMCPALAVTATFETSLGMGLLVIFVLTSSNVAISLLKKYILFLVISILAKKNTEEELNAFTIGSSSKTHDESNNARKYAETFQVRCNYFASCY